MLVGCHMCVRKLASTWSSPCIVCHIHAKGELMSCWHRWCFVVLVLPGYVWIMDPHNHTMCKGRKKLQSLLLLLSEISQNDSMTHTSNRWNISRCHVICWLLWFLWRIHHYSHGLFTSMRAFLPGRVAADSVRYIIFGAQIYTDEVCCMFRVWVVDPFQCFNGSLYLSQYDWEWVGM